MRVADDRHVELRRHLSDGLKRGPNFGVAPRIRLAEVGADRVEDNPLAMCGSLLPR